MILLVACLSLGVYASALGRTESASLDTDVLAAISHFDGVIRSVSVDAREVVTVYAPIGDEAQNQRVNLRYPVRSEFTGKCYLRGGLLRTEKAGFDSIAGRHRGESVVISPTEAIVVMHDSQPGEPRLHGTVVRYNKVPRVFEASVLSPTYWLSWFGTPFSEHFQSDNVSIRSVSSMTVGGEQCYRISFHEYGSNQFEILINGDKGYRPQRMSAEYVNGSRWQMDIRLERFSDNVWYPKSVVMRFFNPPTKASPNGILTLERRIEFKNFRANMPVPESAFEIPKAILDSKGYAKIDRR